MTNKISDPGKLIEKAREEFQFTLAGTWIDILDYYPGPKQMCQFYPDGTGYIHVTSGMGNEINWFEWRNIGPLEMETRFTESYSTYPPDEDENELNEDYSIQRGVWMKTCYDFKVVDYYCPHIVLTWKSSSPDWITLCYEDYFYQGPLKGTAPGKDHFITLP